MNATQKTEIRRQLLAERERIVAEWQDHGGAAGPGPDWNLRDPEERAVHSSSDTVDQQIAGDDRNLLRKVEFALERLDAGTYTQCESCGQTIPAERLAAKPSVSLCLSCQKIKDATKH